MSGIIEWHGWDATSSAWHGPDELDFSLAGCRGLLGRLRQSSGSWYGRLRAQSPGGLPFSLWAGVHDLGDSSLATLNVDGATGGPSEVVLVVPAERRSKLREEFAFEFVSYLTFLEGAARSGRELALNEHVEQTLAAAPLTNTVVFSVENGILEPDMQLLVSENAERLAMAMIAWMREKDELAQAGVCIPERAAAIEAGVLQ
jgi:hypothetical protein